MPSRLCRSTAKAGVHGSSCTAGQHASIVAAAREAGAGADGRHHASKGMQDGNALPTQAKVHVAHSKDGKMIVQMDARCCSGWLVRFAACHL